MKRRHVAAALAALCGPPARGAQALHLVVAYPPGGLSDGVARALATELTALLDTTVLVEHRPGAGGAIAMEWLAKAPPDGRTLVFCAISPLTLPGRELWRGVVPVMSVMVTPVLVVGTPALAALGADARRSFVDMLVSARAAPGRLRWATSGPGTVGHRVLEAVNAAAGVQIAHIPYKGGAQQLNDALGGQFELLSTNVGAQQLAHVAAGRLHALAVGAPARLPVLPHVPTLAELGFADANLASVFGLYAPAGTPPAIVERLNAALNAALRSAAIRDRLIEIDNLPTGGSAAAFAAQIERERAAARRAR